MYVNFRLQLYTIGHFPICSLLASYWIAGQDWIVSIVSVMKSTGSGAVSHQEQEMYFNARLGTLSLLRMSEKGLMAEFPRHKFGQNFYCASQGKPYVLV